MANLKDELGKLTSPDISKEQMKDIIHNMTDNQQFMLTSIDETSLDKVCDGLMTIAQQLQSEKTTLGAPPDPIPKPRRPPPQPELYGKIPSNLDAVDKMLAEDGPGIAVSSQPVQPSGTSEYGRVPLNQNDQRAESGEIYKDPWEGGADKNQTLSSGDSDDMVIDGVEDLEAGITGAPQEGRGVQSPAADQSSEEYGVLPTSLLEKAANDDHKASADFESNSTHGLR